MSSFFMLGAEKAVGPENQLRQLEKLLNWKRFEKYLVGIHVNDINPQGGPKSYDKQGMFKAILLGQWHSLSDRELENSLRVRLDFMVFTGFELDGDFPDASTLCRFRNLLISKGLMEKLLKEVNRQLAKLNLSIKNAEGAVIDATVIESAARPRRTLTPTEIPKDREETETPYQCEESVDPDARWLKKGKHCYFGYKGFIRTTEGSGFIESLEVTSANEAEVNQLEAMTTDISRKRSVYGDKAYASQSNDELLSQRGLKNRLMYKAARNRPLTHWEKVFNRLVSKRRFIVEQAFGTLKRRFEFMRASYRGRAKVLGQFYLKAMCYNLLKGLNGCFSG